MEWRTSKVGTGELVYAGESLQDALMAALISHHRTKDPYTIVEDVPPWMEMATQILVTTGPAPLPKGGRDV